MSFTLLNHSRPLSQLWNVTSLDDDSAYLMLSYTLASYLSWLPFFNSNTLHLLQLDPLSLISWRLLPFLRQLVFTPSCKLCEATCMLIANSSLFVLSTTITSPILFMDPSTLWSIAKNLLGYTQLWLSRSLILSLASSTCLSCHGFHDNHLNTNVNQHSFLMDLIHVRFSLSSISSLAYRQDLFIYTQPWLS